MCGIMGYIGDNEASPILLEGLRYLEYRGYDSSGVAVLGSKGLFASAKAEGKIASLELLLKEKTLPGSLGIGHTRWATHGIASSINAHPHFDCTGSTSVVLNGIVENYRDLKIALENSGHHFESQTDAEVIPHLIEDSLKEGYGIDRATSIALSKIKGSVTLLVASSQDPSKIIAARMGNSGGLVIGRGSGELFVASDLPAILPFSKEVMFIDPGEIASLSSSSVLVRDNKGSVIEKPFHESNFDLKQPDKGGYDWFMLKEIMEQPDVLLKVISGRIDMDSAIVNLPELMEYKERLDNIERVILLGCGTSYHAALSGRQYIESISKLPAQAELASEFRYSDMIIKSTDLVVSLTQSGETADTLEAMAKARESGALQIVITNVPTSQSTRLADVTLEMRAGLEVGVASTKTFTASLMLLYLLSMFLGSMKKRISHEDMKKRIHDLEKLPKKINRVLDGIPAIREESMKYYQREHFIFMGRSVLYPVALEGALKLKEISYIHSQAYAAGEMKHGAIALISPEVPTLALALEGSQKEKMEANIEEVKARNGIVIGLLTEGDQSLDNRVDGKIVIPDSSKDLLPILAVIPLQLFAYFIGIAKGLDIDKPRNLAKSVTVE